MRDKIIELFKNYSWQTTDEAGNVYTVIDDDDFEEIAEKIDLLYIRNVGKPINENCNE